MNVISCQQINLPQYGLPAHRHAYQIHVQITNPATEAAHIISTLSNTSWIHNLDVIDADAYLERATPTINKLVGDVLSKVSTTISDELGEYLVSSSAKEVLCTSLLHTDIPLAELWKEKLTGNPGFDFHTESPAEILVFGEAKYSGSINPHSNALEQINNFITDRKDHRELSDLRRFSSENATNRAHNDTKGFAAAFALNSQNIQRIFNNAIRSAHFSALLQYEEIYIIGVEI